MSCFRTGGPDKEYGTNKPPPTGRVRESSKGDTTCPSTSQNPSCLHPAWLSDVCATRKDSELEWSAKDHTETNPITIKPETMSHRAELFSWAPSPSCSPPGCPFPVISLALSAHVSTQTIHFQVLDKSPVSGPGRGHPSCNTTISSYAASLSPSALNLSQHQGLFQWISSLHQVVKALELQLQQILPVKIQGWFPLGLTDLTSLLSKVISRIFSSTTVWKHQFFGAQPFLWANSDICTWLLEKP